MKTVHENPELDAHWKPSYERGFLPRTDPLKPGELSDNHPEYTDLEIIGARLPILLEMHAVRNRLDTLEIIELQENLTGPELDRLFQLYSFFASAYVHAKDKKSVSHIPKGIAVPLVQLSDILDRPPILSYTPYSLGNWKRIDPKGPIAYDNLHLVQRFEDKGKDETGFGLIHVDIEGRGGSKVLKGLCGAHAVLQRGGMSSDIANALEDAPDGLARMNRTMNRMPDACSKERYAAIVRPYIFGFNTVVYKGVEKFNGRPRTFYGETGAQSSIAPAVDTALDIRPTETKLTKYLQEMRGYMPRPHREFLQFPEKNTSLREAAILGTETLRRRYNETIQELLAFNETHYRYALEYIEQKEPEGDPRKYTGTGGTEFTKFLWQLHTDRKRHLL